MDRSCCLLGCWCFWALTEGARRATGVSAQEHFATGCLLVIFGTTSTPLLPHRLALQFDPVRRMYQPVQDTVSHRGVADLRMLLRHLNGAYRHSRHAGPQAEARLK